MKRLLFNVAIGVSASVCVTIVVLWARSYWVGTALGWTRPNIGAIGLVCSGGYVTVSWGPSVDHGGSAGRKSGRNYYTWKAGAAPLKDHPRPGSPPRPPHVGPWAAWKWEDGWLDQEYGFTGSYLGPWPVPLNKLVITDTPKDWVSASVDRTEWEAVGFCYQLNFRVYPDLVANVKSRRLLIGNWFLLLMVALSAMPSIIRVRSYLRRRRAARKGRCSFCGYDLRATPDRCPECGAIPVASSGAGVDLELEDASIAAINEGEDQADRGEGVDLDTFRATMNKRFTGA
jgi:hypothetical protein